MKKKQQQPQTIDEELLKGFRERYSDVHPLLFQRSVEKANTPGELFDILETIPEYPVIWCDKKRSWKTTDDIFQKKELDRKA
ncbi:MAG: hypothetical protein ACW987_02670, partial [Candidatus Thorarchaeota archaeon]